MGVKGTKSMSSASVGERGVSLGSGKTLIPCQRIGYMIDRV